MKLAIALTAVVACAVPDDPIDEGTVEQAGTTIQGTTIQGTTIQGTYGGSVSSSGGVAGTALWFALTRPDGTIETHWPNKLCTRAPGQIFDTCTFYNLATQASPLAGSQWPSTFVKKNADGTTTTYNITLQIGSSASDLTAVKADTSTAMFALRGSGATGALVNCENPSQCRVNSDLWLLAVRAVDVLDASGNPANLCPPGESAMALAGTWDLAGNPTSDPIAGSDQFSLVCTNGTIAKCTRWGYRPWTQATYSNDTQSPARFAALADYHTACVHAAAADYCGTGQSFTKNGTIVDIYDYPANQLGFVPEMDGKVLASNVDNATAFEAEFDKHGAWRIDHARYDELQYTQPDYNINTVCPGTFYMPQEISTYMRHTDTDGVTIYVDSTPACMHDEFTVGKWLSPRCSGCVGEVGDVMPSCTSPTGSWTSACVAEAQSNAWCTTGYWMASHSECTTGGGLGKYSSGCTLKMSLDGHYASCFNTLIKGAWSSTCVAGANAICTGGRENRLIGFCGTP